MEKELRGEIEGIERELGEYKAILAERERESEEIIEQKNHQLEELLARLTRYEETFQRQESRIRQVESELANLGALMEAFQ